MTKPGIIVVSDDDEDTFRWLSDGWYTIKKRQSREAQDLFRKAEEAIDKADDVEEAMKLLKESGFSVRRGTSDDYV